MRTTKERPVKKAVKKAVRRRKIKISPIYVPLSPEGLADVKFSPREIDILKDLVYYRIIDVKEDAYSFDDSDAKWKHPFLAHHLKEKIQELDKIFSKLMFEV